jgi:hypothetical protein
LQAIINQPYTKKNKFIMDRNQESSAGSFLKIKNFGIKNATKIATIAGMPALFTTHSTNITDLFAADAGARADVRGYAVDKGIRRKAVETTALKISNAISAFAAINNDNALLKRADASTSTWYSISEEELITQATIVRDLATPIIASLSTLAILPADLTALTTAINTFVAVISDPSLAIDVRKEDNTKVADLIDKTRLHLDTKLDIVMRVFEATDPVFYKLYKDARALDVNGSILAPTQIIDMPPQYLKTMIVIDTYNADTLFTFQNNSQNNDVFISLSTIDNEQGDNIIQIPAGETRQRLLANLAPDGKFLVGVNKGNVPAVLKIWVEE